MGGLIMYDEIWNERHYKYASWENLKHVSWDNYKKIKRQNSFTNRFKRFIRSEHEEILFFVSVASILFITISLFN